MQAISEFFVSHLTTFISNFGIWAVFILMAAESALIPIPSEITMPFAGFLSGRGIFNIWMVIFIGATGNLIGSLIAYFLGYKMHEEWIRSAIRKWGKYLLLHEKDFDKSLSWFQKYGQGVAFGSRLLPIVRTFISLPAGIAKMNLAKFSILTFLGSFLWSGILAYIGYKLGQNWLALEPYFRKFQFLIIALGIFAIGFYIYKHLKEKA